MQRNIIQDDFTSHYYKIVTLLDLLKDDLIERQYDWYYWVDGDAIFTNFSINIHDFLPSSLHHSHYNLIVAATNSGVFLIRNCQWSYDFLWSVFLLRTDPAATTTYSFDNFGWSIMVESHRFMDFQNIFYPCGRVSFVSISCELSCLC